MSFQGFLRQSTAVDVKIGPFVDSGDGDAEETGLTIAQADVLLSKNGQTGAQKNDATSCAHAEDGMYNCELDATDTDTVGQLTLGVHVASALFVRHDWQVVEEAVYDRDYASGATGVDPDWTNAGRLDAILDSIAADVVNIDGVAMRGTDGANTTTPPTAGTIADAVQDEPIEGHVVQGTTGWATALAVYAGPDGPGIYIDSGAGNTNTVVGTDGTEINPVSTFAAARTLANALGLKIYYLEGNSDITLAATHVDWEFIGIGSVADNIVNLGSQDVSRSLFRNLTVEGIQGGTGRITARDCALQDPGAGATTLHMFAERCGFVDRIEVDTSNDNVFDQCFSLVAGTAAPVIVATGAAGTISVRHYSGGLEFESLSASHNVTWEGIGQIIFNANCNVNANVSVRGVGAIIDNTAGMAALTETSLVNMTKINTECDTALSDMGFSSPRKNVALADISVFMVASSDHVTPKTGLTLTVTRSLDGGAFGAGTGSAAEIANGMYQYDASQADMNADVVIFRFTGTDADDTFLTIHTRS